MLKLVLTIIVQCVFFAGFLIYVVLRILLLDLKTIKIEGYVLGAIGKTG